MINAFNLAYLYLTDLVIFTVLSSGFAFYLEDCMDLNFW